MHCQQTKQAVVVCCSRFVGFGFFDCSAKCHAAFSIDFPTKRFLFRVAAAAAAGWYSDSISDDDVGQGCRNFPLSSLRLSQCCHSLTRQQFQWPASQSEAAYPTMYAHVHVSIHRTSDVTSRTSSTRRERMQSPDTVSWSFLQLSLTNRQHLVEP